MEISWWDGWEETAPSVARRFAPILCFHEHEVDFPTDVDEYIQNCALVNASGEVVRETGRVAWPHLAANEGSGLRPDPAYLARPNKPRQVYAVSKILADGRVVIAYILFYAKQDAIPILCGLGRTGAHAPDAEYVYVLTDPGATCIEWMFLSAHGWAESSWVHSGDMAFDAAAARPVVHVALTSHANYWSAVARPRLWGMAVDVCSPLSSGIILDSASCLTLLGRDHPWLSYVGGMGDGVVSSIGFRGHGYMPDTLDLPPVEGHDVDSAATRRFRRCS